MCKALSSISSTAKKTCVTRIHIKKKKKKTGQKMQQFLLLTRVIGDFSPAVLYFSVICIFHCFLKCF
jgi:hypothetical protein